MLRRTWNSLKSMIAPHRHCIVPFLSTNGSYGVAMWRDRTHWKEYSIGFFAVSLSGVPISCSVSAPSAYSINTRRCNRHPSIPQIDSDVRNSRNSFYHGKPAYSTAAWSADGRPLQTPPASLSSLRSDRKMLLCPLLLAFSIPVRFYQSRRYER